MKREDWFLIVGTWFLIVSNVFFVTVASCNAPAPKTFEPNQMQALRLLVKQRDAQIANIGFQQAQVNFQQALGALNREADTVKDENKWPKELLFRPDSLKFEMPPPPPVPEPKKK